MIISNLGKNNPLEPEPGDKEINILEDPQENVPTNFWPDHLNYLKL